MYIYLIVFLTLILILIWQSSLKCNCGSSLPEYFCGCSVKVENFISSVFCDEKLTYDGINYQLWKNNRITHVFKTYLEYKKYWEFAHGNRKDKYPCILLKPIKTNINKADGTIISTPELQKVDTRFFNIEHFEGNRDVGILNNQENNENIRNDTKASFIYKIKDASYRYMRDNPECYERLKNKDSEYYMIFQKSYELYIKERLKQLLGYVPNVKKLDELNIEELEVYYDIIVLLPNCQELIMRYFKPATKHSKKKVSILKDGVNILLEIPEWIYEASESTIDFIGSLFRMSTDYITKPINNGDKGPKSIDDNIASNFAYTPSIRYPEKKPDNKIANSYGWSVIPPQFWSVPQSRPPICLPSDNNVSTVTAIYDKSVPLNALELNKINFPENTTGVDKRFLNSDYYYPGIYINKGEYDPNL